MRLLEFEKILETSYLDAGDYGTWIDTKTNKIITVESHIDYLTLRYENRKTEFGFPYGDGIDEYPEEHYDELYQRAYEDGLVRTTHEPYGSINISGTVKALKKAWKLIRETAITQDVVYVSIVKDIDTFDDYTFNIPKDRAKLIKLMNSL